MVCRDVKQYVLGSYQLQRKWHVDGGATFLLVHGTDLLVAVQKLGVVRCIAAPDCRCNVYARYR